VEWFEPVVTDPALLLKLYEGDDDGSWYPIAGLNCQEESFIRQAFKDNPINYFPFGLVLNRYCMFEFASTSYLGFCVLNDLNIMTDVVFTYFGPVIGLDDGYPKRKHCFVFSGFVWIDHGPSPLFFPVAGLV
jgi:hypothetical protein